MSLVVTEIAEIVVVFTSNKHMLQFINWSQFVAHLATVCVRYRTDIYCCHVCAHTYRSAIFLVNKLCLSPYVICLVEVHGKKANNKYVNCPFMFTTIADLCLD